MRMVIPNSTGRLLDELSSDVNAFFETLLGEEPTTSQASFVPRVDFEDREDAYVLYADLPGMKAEDIHVDVEDEHVKIYGTRLNPFADGETDTKPHRRVERVYGDFARLVQLAKPVNADAVSASYQDGVLIVTLPKVAKEGPRRVSVSSGTPSE